MIVGDSDRPAIVAWLLRCRRPGRPGHPSMGLWRSPVAHLVRIEGVRGSNPLSSTIVSDSNPHHARCAQARRQQSPLGFRLPLGGRSAYARACGVSRCVRAVDLHAGTATRQMARPGGRRLPRPRLGKACEEDLVELPPHSVGGLAIQLLRMVKKVQGGSDDRGTSVQPWPFGGQFGLGLSCVPPRSPQGAREPLQQRFPRSRPGRGGCLPWRLGLGAAW